MSEKVEKKALALQYRYLMVGGALLLIVVGLALILIVSFAIGEPIELGYEAVHDILGIGIAMLMQIIQIIGIIILIPGALLLVSAILLHKVIYTDVETLNEVRKKGRYSLKIVKIVVIVSSIFLFIVIPLGTCIGISLLRESWMLKE